MNDLKGTVLECKSKYDLELALDTLACGKILNKCVNSFNKDIYTYTIECFSDKYDIVVEAGIPVRIYFY